MFAGIFHGSAQVAASLIQIQRACLKDGFLLTAVEIAEGDEIVRQEVQVPAIPEKPLHRDDGVHFRFHGLVPRDETQEKEPETWVAPGARGSEPGQKLDDILAEDVRLSNVFKLV